MTTPEGAPDAAIDALRVALGAQYEVIRRVGIGGMGSVYLARDKTLDREVAVKVINPEVASNAALRERFLQEARTVARLRHPGIVSVYAAGESEGLLYFVMEYVPGESLRELLAREGKPDIERGARIVREMALALDHAHALGLVHRDVKPENILIDGTTGRAMLTDFGVARAFEKDGGMTQTGMILGSPRYMSPEQASGDRVIDGRSDLYALALVGYEIFTGAPVVQASSAAAMLVKHLTETPPPLAEKVADLPLHIAEAIDRGLAKNPDERWQTGREFAEALAGGQLTPTGERAGATMTGLRSAPVRRRIPAWVLPAAAVAVAVAIGSWFAWGRTGAGADANDRTYVVAPFEIQSGDQRITWLREGSVNMLTLALSQWSDLRVVDYERTLSLLDAENLGDKARLTLDDARALARRAQAGVVVTGQVQTPGDSLLVIAKLYDARTGNALEQAQEVGALTDDPRPVFDRLARQLLSIKGGPSSTVELTAATTTSIVAYRAYLDGVRFLNSWRLAEADSAFAVAIAADSTFALAYHKRSLGKGWSEAGGPLYISSAERAFELSARLPARERALVEGHYYLVKGLAGGFGSVNTDQMASYERAVRVYDELIARDSLVPEAWYGWADANFHGRSADNLPELVARTNRAIAGFHRTLAIDSSFHLAYSHLVQIYNAAASPSDGFLIDADTAIILDSQEVVTRLGGPAAIARLRTAAGARGIEIARAWTRSDPDASQPIVQLAQSYAAAGQTDSALYFLKRRAQERGAHPAIATLVISYQILAADTALATTLPPLLARYTPDSLRLLPINQRLQAGANLITAGAMLGNAELAGRAATLFERTDSVMPGTTLPSTMFTHSAVTSLNLAMGAPVTPAVRRALTEAVRRIDTLQGPAAMQARNSALSNTYLSFLVTHDTLFSQTLGRWVNAPDAFPELDALTALDRGDTVTARRIATAFPIPDSLRTARFGFGGMRSVARAEVLARLGLTRQAAEMYEVTSPDRFTLATLSEPGIVVWVRTWLDRARLWAQIGERERAINAYEEFIRRWSLADGAAAEQVRQARRELNALTDAPPRR